MNRKLLKEFGISEAFGLEPMGDRFGPDDPARIEELENLLGKPLPDDYRCFVLELAPCMFTKNVAFRSVEPNPWSSEGLNSFDEFHGLEKDSATDLIDHYRDMNDVLPAGMFAIGHDPGANNILMSLNDPPWQIYFEDKDDGEVYLCANTFTEFLQSFELLPDEEV